MNLLVRSSRPLSGTLSPASQYTIPGDKSLSHRAALFAALADGQSEITNFLDSGVTKVLLRALAQLGVEYELRGSDLRIQGKGMHSFQPSDSPLYCGNSATTLRLLCGALAASGTAAVLDGSEGLRKRPMDRIVEPLRAMGVPVHASAQECAPLRLTERDPANKLHAAEFSLPHASAQVKTCLLLAGLGADGELVIREPAPSRDHSERMLRAMGVDLHTVDDLTIALTPPVHALQPLKMSLPGDFSAAAFLIVAALITPGSDILICNVGLNPGRTGLLDVLLAMGANIEVRQRADQGGEPCGDIRVRHSRLQGVSIAGDLVVRMIDEFPVFAIAAASAAGPSHVCDAIELRYKESDRISALVDELKMLGIRAQESEDGFTIEGGGNIRGGQVQSHADHRLAMSLAVAGLASQNDLIIRQAELMDESFPHFFDLFTALGAEMVWLP